MLIKEYRIPMPLTVNEYRIAQLYMIQVRVERRVAQKMCGFGVHCQVSMQRAF